MITKQFPEIIQKYCMKEIQNIINKYNNIAVDDIACLEEFMYKISNNNLQEELYKDFDKSLKIARELQDTENKEKIISMFLEINESNLMSVSIRDVMEYCEELIHNDYIIIDDSYIIYKKNSNYRSLAREMLDSMLDDATHVDRLLDKDSLIEYWMEETSKSDVIEDLIGSVDIEELLDLNPIVIYEDDFEEYMISEIEM